MFDPLNKLLTNPIRLMVMSVLVRVESCEFNYLKKVTNSTQGNLSVQLKKLYENEYITISKSFENNYPKTTCSVTKKGVDAFEKHFKTLNQYKNPKF
jgi:DNA-binding MarR family transcriptional regulator